MAAGILPVPRVRDGILLPGWEAGLLAARDGCLQGSGHRRVFLEKWRLSLSMNLTMWRRASCPLPRVRDGILPPGWKPVYWQPRMDCLHGSWHQRIVISLNRRFGVSELDLAGSSVRMRPNPWGSICLTSGES